jgi:hypothetical protein
LKGNKVVLETRTSWPPIWLDGADIGKADAALDISLLSAITVVTKLDPGMDGVEKDGSCGTGSRIER